MIFVGLAANAQPRARQFPPGTLNRLEDLPASGLRTRIEQLPAAARTRAVAWLRNFHFTELDLESLHVDAEGALFYADKFTVELPSQAPAEPIVAQGSVPVEPFPETVVFHSKPGAQNILYLNFTGESVTGTAWNNSLGRATIPVLAFSTDSDYANFSDAEQVAIKRIWQRVAEDYAPFEIDVTTERPASFNPSTAHAIITRNTDADDLPNPASSSGGVAYVNVFGNFNYATYRPAWIYCNNLANNESYIAEAVSHEVGHNLGLSHDGKTDGAEYYRGHGTGSTSWAPIMGGAYSRNVSQWSKGEYYLANNTQDDLATIGTKLGYRNDDHGDTLEGATPLVLSGPTIVSTTPENDPAQTNSANKGTLERSTDVDMFSFETGNGTVDLTVDPWIMPAGTLGGNLDIGLELRDGAGTIVASNDPAGQTYAQIQATLPAGTYYLLVRDTGIGSPMSSTPSGYTSYGSLGQYFISGFVAPSAAETQIGANGIPLWQSYIAGLDPNDPNSQLRLYLDHSDGSDILRWNTAPGRLYTLWASTNLGAGFTAVPGASDLSATTLSFTNRVNTTATFYRLEVRKP